MFVNGLDWERKTYCSHACWVRLDSCDASLLCFTNNLWSDALVQIERHEIVYIWLDLAQTVAILKALLDSCDGRNKVGLPILLVYCI